MDTCSSPLSVRSCWSTQSHPSGSIAPVMMRMASPDARGREGTIPAYTVSTTGSTTGCSRLAPARSAERRA